MTKFNIKNFWLTFFITVAVLAISLSVYFCISYQRELANIKSNVVTNESFYKRRVENAYRQNLYNIEDSLKNLDANLGKTALSNDSSMQTDRLLNIVSQANNLSSNVANLPVTASENLDKIEAFANQLGDYSISLVKRLQSGDKLTAKDKATLLSLDATCNSLYNGVKDFTNGEQSQLLVDKLFADGSGAISNFVDNIDSKVFEYEKLIYDGPYSDAVEKQSLQCSTAVSIEEGVKIVKDKFNATKVEFISEIKNNGVFYLYNISMSSGNGRVMLACNGSLAELELTPNQQCKYNIDSECAMDVAKQFCQKQGFDVEPIWVSALSDDVIYVNLAPIKDEAVIYCDLVKVAVSCNGMVIGAETRAYLTNHHNHNVKFGSVTMEQATESMKGLKVANVRKAVVNKLGKEYACWEVEGDFEGNQYFVYIDSTTGKEIDIFRVIEGTEGHTVL